MSYRRKRPEQGGPGDSVDEISEEGHFGHAVDGDDRSREDQADGEGSSDSEGRRMVLRSQTGKPQRKRRWTADYTDEADDDVYDDDDESGSYKGNTRKLRVGKPVAARDPLPKRSSRHQNSQAGGLQYNTRGKSRGKRELDLLDDPAPPPASKRSNAAVSRGDDDESAIASLLGLADAVDSIFPTQQSSIKMVERSLESSVSKPPAAAFPQQPVQTPAQLMQAQQLQLQQLTQLQQQQQQQQQLMLLQHQQQPQQIIRAASISPYYHATSPSTFPGLDAKSLPFAYGSSGVGSNVVPSRGPPRPSRVEETKPSTFSSPQAALSALDSAASALRSSKRCLAHVTIAYSAFYAQKRQELSEIMKQEPNIAAKHLSQFDLDPTSVARALKEKSDQTRAASIAPSGQHPLQSVITPHQRAMLAAQQTSLAYQPQLLAGKLSNFANSFPSLAEPAMASAEDVQAIQLQLAQQYQMMHANPALLQQMALHHPLVNPFLMARTPLAPTTSPAVASSLSPIPLVQPAVDHTLPNISSTIQELKGSKPSQNENFAIANSSPTPQIGANTAETTAQSTTELAVRSFGALLNGISASETAKPASKLADTSATGAENPLLTMGKA